MGYFELGIGGMPLFVFPQSSFLNLKSLKHQSQIKINNRYFYHQLVISTFGSLLPHHYNFTIITLQDHTRP